MGAMDTIRTLAEERHFFTAEVQLADQGQVLLVGDHDAVERVLGILREHLDLPEREQQE